MRSIIRKIEAMLKVKQDKSSKYENKKSTCHFISQGNKYLCVTKTGEIFQPTRVHFVVVDKEKLMEKFLKIKCIQHDVALKRWVWVYTAEARKIRFKKKPVENDAVVIGEFIFKGESELVLNLRSWERATEAIVFFDKYLSRKIAEVTDVTIINRFFDKKEVMALGSIDGLFDSPDLVVRNPDELSRQLLDIKDKTHGFTDMASELLDFIRESSKKPDPKIEKFPAHYYEEGIEPLRFSLRLRQKVAMEHWSGNVNYTLNDAIGLRL